MDEREKKKDNVYGENHPASEGRSEPGIRERAAKEDSTDETLEQIRKDDAKSGENAGGMGRANTPRDGKTEGAWQHAEEGREDVER